MATTFLPDTKRRAHLQLVDYPRLVTGQVISFPEPSTATAAPESAPELSAAEDLTTRSAAVGGSPAPTAPRQRRSGRLHNSGRYVP